MQPGSWNWSTFLVPHDSQGGGRRHLLDKVGEAEHGAAEEEAHVAAHLGHKGDEGVAEGLLHHARAGLGGGGEGGGDRVQFFFF